MEFPIYRKPGHAEPIRDLREWPVHRARDFSQAVTREELLEPLNSTAEKIVHYRTLLGDHTWCPKSPWLDDHERFFLPAFTTHNSYGHPEILEPRQNDWPWASSLVPPRYRVTKSLSFGYMKNFAEGQPVGHMGWPLPEWALKPECAQAENIVEYFEKYRHLQYRGLLRAPFDILSGEVFLPELEDVREAA